MTGSNTGSHNHSSSSYDSSRSNTGNIKTIDRTLVVITVLIRIMVTAAIMEQTMTVKTNKITWPWRKQES